MERRRNLQRTLARLVAATLVTSGLAAGAAEPPPECHSPMPPARMSYLLLDDGRKRGEATAELQPVGDGTWRYEVMSRGRAGLITVRSTERSTFDWVDGVPRPLEFSRETKAGPFRRLQTAAFDWEAGTASGEYKGKAWEAEVERGTLDRLLLQLASARLIAGGADAVNLGYLDRGRPRRLDDDAVEVTVTRDSAGKEWPAVRVDRVRGNRVTSTWHATEAAFLPIRVEHSDPDDDEHWTLQLEAIEWLPCPEPVAPASVASSSPPGGA